MTSSELLLTFAKNPVFGKVKTRLAASIGEEQAFNVYKQLLQHTHYVAENLRCDKIVYYSDFINPPDCWDGFEAAIQHGPNLGERMKNAFRQAFASGHEKVVIIGTDCFEITTGMIEQSFRALDNYDVVIGPASDGGYYLLGTKQLLPQLFEGITWSTPLVCSETVSICDHHQWRTFLLPVLNDVDEEKDLPENVFS